MYIVAHILCANERIVRIFAIEPQQQTNKNRHLWLKGDGSRAPESCLIYPTTAITALPRCRRLHHLLRTFEAHETGEESHLRHCFASLQMISSEFHATVGAVTQFGVFFCFTPSREFAARRSVGKPGPLDGVRFLRSQTCQQRATK